MAIIAKERPGFHLLTVGEKRQRPAILRAQARDDIAAAGEARRMGTDTLRTLHPISSIRRGKGHEVAAHLAEAVGDYGKSLGLLAIGMAKGVASVASQIDNALVTTGTIVAHPIAMTDGHIVPKPLRERLDYDKLAERRDRINGRLALPYRMAGIGAMGALLLTLQSGYNLIEYGQLNPFYAPPVYSI